LKKSERSPQNILESIGLFSELGSLIALFDVWMDCRLPLRLAKSQPFSVRCLKLWEFLGLYQ
jgi:hypothetical protein